MNSKTAQLTENGTEIVRLFARFALGASFLSAVADRFGLWGPYGAKNVSWGDFAHFVEYSGAVMSLFPSSLTVSFAWAATVAETLFGYCSSRGKSENGRISGTYTVSPIDVGEVVAQEGEFSLEKIGSKPLLIQPCPTDAEVNAK